MSLQQGRTSGIIAAAVLIILIIAVLSCGCLRTEPEELVPEVTRTHVGPAPPTSGSPQAGEPGPGVTREPPGPISISVPRESESFADQDFPEEVRADVLDFVSGKTTDTVNGFLRWESVRARTNESAAARIRAQIGHIDYAVFNTTLKESVRVYTGITGEQAKRIRNESVVSESGYIIASSDPSVIYHRLAENGRDREGFLFLCAFDLRKGDHVLFVNATDREFLVPRGGIWDLDREEVFPSLTFTPDSVLRYPKEPESSVRILYTREHP